MPSRSLMGRRGAKSLVQAHSPYTLSCRVWVRARPCPPAARRSCRCPDSSGRSSRLRLLCSWARPRKRERYSVSGEPRKNVARSSSEGQRISDGLSDLETGRVICHQQRRAAHLALHLGTGDKPWEAVLKGQSSVTLPVPNLLSLCTRLSCYGAEGPSLTQAEGALCPGLGIKEQ